MQDLMTSRYRRRTFLATAVVTSLAFLAIRFFVLPYFSEQVVPSTSTIVASILDTLFTSMVASVAVTSLVFWLTPSVMRTAVMEVVEPTKIPETLEEALGGTNEWWYRGHSGRHFRSVTLPQLAADARTFNATKKVVLQLLDPTSVATCEYYAGYRLRLRSAARDREWTADRVRLELDATIISVSSWKTREPYLDVTLALITTVSLFRVDLSSKLAIITKEDPREPALRCDAGTIFYNSYREDLRFTLQQARVLPDNVRGPTLTALTPKEVRRTLSELGLGSQNLDDASVAEMIRLAHAAENPYV